MRKKFIVFCLLVLPWAGFDGDGVGEISYIADRATITRNGKTQRADFGSQIENFDSITTAAKGLAEIAVYPETGIDGTIRVQPNTTLYLELSSLRGEQKAAVELLSGSVSAAVKKLAGKSEFAIRGQGVVMGVRGTSFDVATSAAGDVLVTCSEGRVVCTDENGTELAAEPGTAVEKTADGDFRSIPVRVSDIEAFRRNWNAEKIEAFKANAGLVIRDYAARYIDLKAKFDEAYRGLLVRHDILDKWFREDAKNTVGTKVETMREKTALMPALMKIRGVNFLFERVYHRLLELQEYHRQGFGKGYVGGGVNADQFFRRLQNEAGDLENRTGIVRYALKLYAKRNDGVSLFDDLLGGKGPVDSGISEEEDFFKSN